VADQLDRELDEMLEKLQKINTSPPEKEKSRIKIHQPQGGMGNTAAGGYIPPANDFPEPDGQPEDTYADTGGGFENHVPAGTRVERPGTRSSRTAFRFFGNSWDGERVLTIILTVVTVIAVIFIIANFEAVTTIFTAGFLYVVVNSLKVVIAIGLIVLIIAAIFGGRGGRGRRYF